MDKFNYMIISELENILSQKRHKLEFLKSNRVTNIFSISNMEEKIIKIDKEINELKKIIKFRINNNRGVIQWE